MKRNIYIVDKFKTIISLGTRVTPIKEGEKAFLSLSNAENHILKNNNEAVLLNMLCQKTTRGNKYVFRKDGRFPEGKGDRLSGVAVPEWSATSGYKLVWGACSYLQEE